MAVLDGLEPRRVFYYFEEISGIPHGSYHTEQIGSYLAEFAKKHGLEYRKDAADNILIRKPAYPGYEDVPGVILQGHSDMVCEKKQGSMHDFRKDGLKLQVEGDWIRAKDTTLGGDDGIAVAYALAILEDPKYRHPALEVIITADEEVGLLGAAAFDASDIKGRYMINMDSEEEGKLWVSCAGGLTAVCELPAARIKTERMQYEVALHGLKGGHSGAEIDKIRANAIKLIGQLMFEISREMEISVVGLESGQKDNAIPRDAKAVFVADPDRGEMIRQTAAAFEEKMRREYAGTDGEISVRVEELGCCEAYALTQASWQKILFLLQQFPYGIQKMSGQIEGLAETSVNPGILRLEERKCRIVASIRSSVGSAKEAQREKVQYLTEFLGGICMAEGEYPAWEYKQDSALREMMADTYRAMFHEEPEVKAIHAGLECGLFSEKIPGLDCVSFGPTMSNIHTTEEALSISSVERMWRYLLCVLENIR